MFCRHRNYFSRSVLVSFVFLFRFGLSKIWKSERKYFLIFFQMFASQNLNKHSCLLFFISCSSWLIICVQLLILFTYILIHKNTSFIHSCWKTLPARRPKPSLDKITKHDELLTINSTSWAQRVWNLYVGVVRRKKKQNIC